MKTRNNSGAGSAVQRDLYQEVTDSILGALENGCAPWIKPWNSGEQDIPVNGCTGRAYRGINTLLLWVAQTALGYASAEWFTFKQASLAGGNVRKKEKATLVVLWKPLEVKDREAPEPDATKTVMLMRHYNVFNREQIEGLPEAAPRPVSGKTWDPVERAEEVVRASKAEITYGGDRACYAPVVDQIRMPAKAAFKESGEFYSTQFHELTHWTGHQSRLAREYGKRFGDSAYAREELVAEMGAAFLVFDGRHCRPSAASGIHQLVAVGSTRGQACRDHGRESCAEGFRLDFAAVGAGGVGFLIHPCLVVAILRDGCCGESGSLP